jgi:hypothetical protein
VRKLATQRRKKVEKEVISWKLFPSFVCTFPNPTLSFSRCYFKPSGLARELNVNVQTLGHGGGDGAGEHTSHDDCGHICK